MEEQFRKRFPPAIAACPVCNPQEYPNAPMQLISCGGTGRHERHVAGTVADLIDKLAKQAEQP